MSKILRIQCGFANAYLITESKNAILVDTAEAGDKAKKRIETALKGYELKLIILTHGHEDHTGNAKYLSEKYNVPIAMSKKDNELALDNSKAIYNSDSLLGSIVGFFSKIFTSNDSLNHFTTDIFLNEGDGLAKYGIDATITELPGHTSGSIGIITKSGVIVGDAMMNMLTPSKSLIYEVKEQREESCRKILELKPTLIYTGHGKEFTLKDIEKQI